MIRDRRVPSDIRARLDRLAEHYRGDKRVVAVYLFGSYARACEGPLSDVDVALLARGVPAGDLSGAGLDYVTEVIRLLGTDEVSFVLLNTAPLTLRYEVVRGGRLLLDNDPPARIAFEAHTEDLYLDFKPLLDAYDQELLRQLAGSST